METEQGEGGARDRPRECLNEWHQRSEVTGGGIRLGRTMSLRWGSVPASCHRPVYRGEPPAGGFYGAVPALFFLGGGRRAGVGSFSCFLLSWLSITSLLSDGWHRASHTNGFLSTEPSELMKLLTSRLVNDSGGFLAPVLSQLPSKATEQAGPRDQ